MVFLLMVLAAVTMVDTRTESRWVESQQQGEAMVMQMMTYHAAAVRRCSTSPCPNGTVQNLAGPPGSRWTYGTDFVSASNGTGTIITVFKPRQMSTDQRYLFGATSAALRKQSGDTPNAGPWMASTQRIGGVSAPAQIAIPKNFGGLSLVDQQPIIATKIN